MFGVAPRSSRIILKVPVSSGRSANTRHTSPPLMLPAGPCRSAPSATARPARGARRLAAALTGGTAAIEGWVGSVGGRLPGSGADGRPGGRRQIDRPRRDRAPDGRRHRRRPVGEHLGVSGSWKERESSTHSANAGHSRPPRRTSSDPCSPVRSCACFSPKTRQIQAFTPARAIPAWNRPASRGNWSRKSRSRHKPCLSGSTGGINHGSDDSGGSTPSRIVWGPSAREWSRSLRCWIS